MKVMIVIVLSFISGFMQVVAAKNPALNPELALQDYERLWKTIRSPQRADNYMAQISRRFGMTSRKIRFWSHRGDQSILVLIFYSRTERFHYQTYNKSYGNIREFLAHGRLERKLHQLNGLHSRQARQAIWEMGYEDSRLRIIATPDEHVIATFYPTGEWAAAMEAIRYSIGLR